MVERKFDRSLEGRSGGGVLEGFRRLPKSIKSIIAGIAASAALTVSEGKANAAMTGPDQVTEYSDLTKVDTRETNPYPNTSLDLGALGVINRVGGIFQLSGVPLSRVGVDSTYPATEVIDSTSYVIVKHQSQVGAASDVAIYDKSNLMGDPVVLKHDKAIALQATLGEVKINNRTFIVVKAHSVGTSHLVFTPAASQAPAMIQLVGASNPIVSPVINGLSANGINENDVVAAKNDVSGKQTLVVNNSQGTYDIFEQTYNQGAQPKPVISLDKSDFTVNIANSNVTVDANVVNLPNNAKVEVNFNGTLIAMTPVDGSDTPADEDSNPDRYFAELNPNHFNDIGEASDYKATVSVISSEGAVLSEKEFSFDIDVVAPNPIQFTIDGAEEVAFNTSKIKVSELPDDVVVKFPAGAFEGIDAAEVSVISIPMGQDMTPETFAGYTPEEVTNYVMSYMKPQGDGHMVLSGSLGSQANVDVNSSEIQVEIFGENSIIAMIGRDSAGNPSVNAKALIAEVVEDPIKDPETKDPETKDPETKDPETKDPEIKDPETKDPETDDPIVVPPVDGGNDDDPSCAIAGVGSKEKAPSKEKLTLASLLALAAFWRRRKK